MNCHFKKGGEVSIMRFDIEFTDEQIEKINKIRGRKNNVKYIKKILSEVIRRCEEDQIEEGRIKMDRLTDEQIEEIRNGGKELRDRLFKNILERSRTRLIADGIIKGDRLQIEEDDSLPQEDKESDK